MTSEETKIEERASLEKKATQKFRKRQQAKRSSPVRRTANRKPLAKWSYWHENRTTTFSLVELRMLGMRGWQEELKCKIQDFKDTGAYYNSYKEVDKTRISEIENVKSRRKYNKIFKGKGDERDPYLALRTYHRPECTDTFYLQPIENPKISM